MLFNVHHKSRYYYNRPVFLESQTIRLRPRNDASQQLLDYQIEITPTPDSRSEYLDAEANHAMTVWFNQLLDHLFIETRFRVETLRSNPFDFLMNEPGCAQLPAVYPADLIPALQCYQGKHAGKQLAAFVGEVRDAAKNDTLTFLNGLCARIYREIPCTVRPSGEPYAAEQTLMTRTGSCRDLAVLFVAACRQVGLAARFVSGYQEGDPDQDDRQLHAWAEVYLPGGGWRGYDPTHGLAVADRHIAVAASHHSGGASPVRGNFRGTGAQSRFEFELEVTTG